MGVNSLPKTVTRQRHGCDLNPGPSASESSTLITRLPNSIDCSRIAISVCVYVCLYVCQLSKSTVTNFSAHAACNHELAFLWRRCSVLRYFRFVDDVMFANC